MIKYLMILVSIVQTNLAFSQNEPGPGETQITEIAFEGTGCPAGSVADSVSPDGRAFTVFFSDFGVTSESHGVTQKQCRTKLTVSAPIDYEFSLVGLDYRGYMDITNKAMLKFSTRASFNNGNGGQKLFDLKFKGPKADEFLFPVRVGDQSKWSGCAHSHRPLVITTEVFLQSASGSGSLVTIDSMDGEFAQQFRLIWRRCR